MSARSPVAEQAFTSSPLSEWHEAHRGLMFGPSLVARLLLALIRLYQLAISPYLGRACRFEPSCSRYAAACLQAHGAARGSLLSVKRLCKCHPFHPGGWDPPPARGGTRGQPPPVHGA